MNIAKIMIICLLGTILIELGFAFIFGIRSKKDILNIVLVNVLTNPLVVSLSLFINIRYGLVVRNTAIIFLEISAVLIEGLIYFRVLDYKKINPLLLSLILNCLSYFIGEIIYKLL